MGIMSYADYKSARHSPVSYDSLSDPRYLRSVRGYIQVAILVYIIEGHVTSPIQSCTVGHSR